MADGDLSKCGRKAALSSFFATTFIAFTFSVIALISPAWQYVYLENGRTEHQHGLWLDCKRDFSFDYGRTREYYETLYRRDLQGSPFDIFFLPPLQCVYKFDYYIDPEDLYDHNHDENRIQNDAYQHLFLGWKIAALSGCGSAVLFSASALLLAVCAFCHRTFICASTVLVSIAAILSSIGVSVFYGWANYQDNKVIKEDEDTTYEQMLGWAFYCQIVTTVIHWLASMLGCFVTSVSFSKTRAKLVKIEVVEGNDESELLPGGRSSTQPFKRSFSAIYRVDSQSLRQWERDYLRNAQERQRGEQGTFRRTSSVPNFSKKQRKAAQRKMNGGTAKEMFSSTSNITDTTHTGKLNTVTKRSATSCHPSYPAQPPPLPALPKLKSALKTPQQSRKSVNIDDSDLTYEYLPCDGSMGVSTLDRRSSTFRTYDPVYEQITQENYLEPNSVRMKSTTTLNGDQMKKAMLPAQPFTGSSQSVPTSQQKTTVIDDVARPSSSAGVSRHANIQTGPGSNHHSLYTVEEMQRTELLRRQKLARDKTPDLPPPKPMTPDRGAKPSISIRDFGISLRPERGYCDVSTKTESDDDPKPTSSTAIKYTQLGKAPDGPKPPSSSPLKYISVQRSNEEQHRQPAGRSETFFDDRHAPHRSDEISASSPGIAINTFGDRGRQRSITNLTFRPQSTTGASEVFERPDSITTDLSSTTQPTPKKPLPLQQLVHRKLISVMPDEVDRSVGSSTILENETIRDSADSYMRDAEIRLNLFMNDSVKDETTV
ncbi:hypothetical protein Q1695_006481 [Nippostrongylus brasiliensis]|nr:hypothetical protein Q1695_006481 [Nippostrongylus brasiliensis]